MNSDSTIKPKRSSDSRIYKAMSEMEGRLMAYWDRSLKEIKDAMREQRDETSGVRQQLNQHESLEGHPLLLQRVKNLEDRLHVNQARPYQIWQVVSVVIFIILSMVGTIASIVSLIHTLAH